MEKPSNSRWHILSALDLRGVLRRLAVPAVLLNGF